MYFQRRDDDFGTDRVDAPTVGAPPPKRGRSTSTPADGIEKAANDGFERRVELDGRVARVERSSAEWELWVELFNDEYHASPVRVRPSQVGLRTVGAEIGEALGIAVPVAFFWAAVGASFVVTSLNDPTNLTFR